MNLLVLGEARSLHTQRMVRPFADAGHRVIVAGFAPAPIPGVEGIALGEAGGGPPGIRFARKALLLRRIVRERRIDLVHAHYITVYGLLALCAGRVPKVLTVHGSDVLLARTKRWNRAVIRIVSRGVDRITSPAPHVTEVLVALGAPPDRIDTFQYGVDLDRFHPAQDAPVSSDAPLRIVSTRRLAPLYRVDLLLMALSRLACDASFEATIAGDGPEAEALERLAWALQLDREVRFLGRLDEDGVARALRSADVYVTCASSDGASLGLLEAMATGLLPIAADIPANRAWIRDGENGLLFRPDAPDALAEALLRAAHDPSLRWKAREANPRIVEERASLKSGITMILSIYNSLLEMRSQGGRA